MLDTLLEELRTKLQTARHVAILTGAGVSAESGIPTFRDAQTGLWAQYDVEDLATPSAFRRNPQLVLQWYAWRRSIVGKTEPNPGHYALAELETLVPKLTLITQNVDGLHQRAGSSAPLELHGNLSRMRCSVEGTIVEVWDEPTDGELPLCPHCSEPLRPDIVWFGELLPETILSAAWEAAETCDFFLSIGTSGVVEPAATLPRVALQNGATVGVLNLDVRTSAQPPLYYLHGKSGELLPKLVQGLRTK